jgi:hypothetical protein
MQDVWNKLQPEWLIWVALRHGVLSEKELRLFAVHCVRSLEQFLTDPRINECVNVAEKFANGEASVTDLELVREAAATMFKTFDVYSTFTANWGRAANKLAYLLTGKLLMPFSLASHAAYASLAIARTWYLDPEKPAAMQLAQAKWLRENTKPNFEA